MARCGWLRALAAAAWLSTACRGMERHRPERATPEQVHIALAGRDASGAPSGMRVAWYTASAPTTPPMVRYGLRPGHLDRQAHAVGQPTEYLKGYGFHHVALLDGLRPSTRYYYAAGSDDGGWSRERSFRTAPSGRDAANAEITVSVFGDLGYGDSEMRPMMIYGIDHVAKNWSAVLTKKRLEKLSPDLDMVWHLGDIGYADDAFLHGVLRFSYEDCYNGFMNWMEDLSATIPYMVSVGNHESECHSPDCLLSWRGHALRNFTAYNSRWHMPSMESGGALSMWYSWNYGPVHFVSINTETDFPSADERETGDSHIPWLRGGGFAAEGEYLRWLEADLKAAASARAAGHGPRWIVVGGHRPHGDIKEEHAPLFRKYGVDLYVSGHGHFYTRGAPVDGTTYIMAGGAGCDEMPSPGTAQGREDDRDIHIFAQRIAGIAAASKACEAWGSPLACTPGFSVPEGSEVFTTRRMSTGVLKADSKTLRWQLLDSETGEVLDSVTIGATEEPRLV